MAYRVDVQVSLVFGFKPSPKAVETLLKSLNRKGVCAILEGSATPAEPFNVRPEFVKKDDG